MTVAYDTDRLAWALAVLTDWPLLLWRSELARHGVARLVVDAAGGFAAPQHPPAGRPWYANLTETAPADAWMRLAAAGLVPLDAVDDPRRRFACSECVGRGGVGHPASSAGGMDPTEAWWDPCGVCGVECDACGGTGTDASATGGACSACVGGVVGSGTVPHPATVVDCVAFAARWPEVIAAEEIARVYVASIDIAGPRPSNVVWRTGPAGESEPFSIEERTPLSLVDTMERWPATWRWHATFAHEATAQLARDPAGWSALMAAWWPVFRPTEAPRSPRLEALRDLAATGFAIADLTPDVITLRAAPPP
jgi:hypothetical protein